MQARELLHPPGCNVVVGDGSLGGEAPRNEVETVEHVLQRRAGTEDDDGHLVLDLGVLREPPPSFDLIAADDDVLASVLAARLGQSHAAQTFREVFDRAGLHL